MNVEGFIADIENHPVVAAIIFFLVAFFGLNFFKKPATTPTPTTGSSTPTPTVSETYNQVYNSYPVVQGTPPPVVTPPVVTPPVVTPPPVTNPCKPGYHFVAGTERPMGILYAKGTYAVSGGVCVPDTPIGNPIPVPPPVVTPPIVTPPPKPPIVTPPPPPPPKKYVTVKHWPDKLSTLSGIAAYAGISLARIEALNPQISNFNLIYAGQQIRVA